MSKWLRALLLACLTILVGQAKAQEQEPPFKGVVKFYPLYLYRIFPSISFGYEHPIAKRWTASLEAGYVVGFIRMGTDYGDKRGLRLRQELRRYFKYKYSETRPGNAHGTYLGFDLHQNFVDYSDEYARAMWREAGFGFKFGMAEFLGRITLDYSIGVSFRYANDTPPDLWSGLVNFWEERNPIIQPRLSLAIGNRLL